MNEITRFIVFIGPISSIFDYNTYFIMLCGMWLPHSPLAPSLGFKELPLLYWPLLLLTLGCYVALTQTAKTVLLRKAWI